LAVLAIPLLCRWLDLSDVWFCRRSALHPGLTPCTPSPINGEGELQAVCRCRALRWCCPLSTCWRGVAASAVRVRWAQAGCLVDGICRRSQAGFDGLLWAVSRVMSTCTGIGSRIHFRYDSYTEHIMGIVNIDDDLHDQIRKASGVSCRSINAQAAFWIKMGMLCEMNPMQSFHEIVAQELRAAGVVPQVVKEASI